MLGDLKAPRFNKRKFRFNVINKDLFNEWKSSTGYKKDFAFFRQVWIKIAEKMIEKVLEERDGIRMGSGLGDIYVGMVPQCKKRAIDYKTSREIGKIVYHENWNTNGKLGKIIYATSDRPYAYRLCRYWGFIPHRLFKRKCVERLRENPENYKNSIERKYSN